MSDEFQNCIKRKKIIKFEKAKEFVRNELDLAESDLNYAKDSLKEENYKWATIQTYYSMFHSARALIYSKGYRERSHYCLIIAIRALFVEKGLLDHSLVEALQLGKTLRENADYYGEFSKEAATQMIEDTEEFLEVAKNLTLN